MTKLSNKQGFTLIEILLVIAIIAILAAIVIIAINPAKQLRDARNAERESEVNTILNAVSQYSIDNNGALPGSISTTATCGNAATEICSTSNGSAVCTGLTDLAPVKPDYIVDVPEDPQDADDNNGTGYHVAADANGRITVCAPDAEGGSTISVSR